MQDQQQGQRATLVTSLVLLTCGLGLIATRNILRFTDPGNWGGDSSNIGAGLMTLFGVILTLIGVYLAFRYRSNRPD